MKNTIFIFFSSLILICCHQTQDKNKISAPNGISKYKENHCTIPKGILDYIQRSSEFELLETKDLKLLEEYKHDTDFSCLLMVQGDFNNNGKEDFAIILRYKNYDFPFLVIFNDFKQEIKPYIVFKTGLYKDDDVKTVIYNQFDEGLFSFLEKDVLCNRDVINIIIPEKSVFTVIWDDVEKAYIYFNSLDDYNCDNRPQDIDQIMLDNLSTPKEVTNFLIFTKDKRDSLQVNSEILDYITNTTTRENSTYLLALEDYGYENRHSPDWSIDELSKIKAYIFNTTYPLRKKYWSDKFEEWYNGKPEVYLGDRLSWVENNYYGLPDLEGNMRDFIITHKWMKY